MCIPYQDSKQTDQGQHMPVGHCIAAHLLKAALEAALPVAGAFFVTVVLVLAPVEVKAVGIEQSEHTIANFCVIALTYELCDRFAAYACGCMITVPAAVHCSFRNDRSSPAGLLGVVGFAAASTLLTATVVDVLFTAGSAGLSGLLSTGAGVASSACTQAHRARQATAKNTADFIL